MCTIVGGNAHRGLDVSIVSERMKCDLQEGLPNIPSLRTRLNIALDVAKALEFLHAQELIHRDVKVQNVLVSTSNRASPFSFLTCRCKIQRGATTVHVMRAPFSGFTIEYIRTATNVLPPTKVGYLNSCGIKA